MCSMNSYYINKIVFHLLLLTSWWTERNASPISGPKVNQIVSATIDSADYENNSGGNENLEVKNSGNENVESKPPESIAAVEYQIIRELQKMIKSNLKGSDAAVRALHETQICMKNGMPFSDALHEGLREMFPNIIGQQEVTNDDGTVVAIILFTNVRKYMQEIYILNLLQQHLREYGNTNKQQNSSTNTDSSLAENRSLSQNQSSTKQTTMQKNQQNNLEYQSADKASGINSLASWRNGSSLPATPQSANSSKNQLQLKQINASNQSASAQLNNDFSKSNFSQEKSNVLTQPVTLPNDVPNSQLEKIERNISNLSSQSSSNNAAKSQRELQQSESSLNISGESTPRDQKPEIIRNPQIPKESSQLVKMQKNVSNQSTVTQSSNNNATMNRKELKQSGSGQNPVESEQKRPGIENPQILKGSSQLEKVQGTISNLSTATLSSNKNANKNQSELQSGSGQKSVQSTQKRPEIENAQILKESKALANSNLNSDLNGLSNTIRRWALIQESQRFQSNASRSMKNATEEKQDSEIKTGEKLVIPTGNKRVSPQTLSSQSTLVPKQNPKGSDDVFSGSSQKKVVKETKFPGDETVEENFTDTTQGNRGMSQLQQAEISSQNQSAGKNRGMSQLRQLETSPIQSASTMKMTEPKKIVQSPLGVNFSSGKNIEAERPLVQSMPKITGGRLGQQIPEKVGPKTSSQRTLKVPQQNREGSNNFSSGSSQLMNVTEETQFPGDEIVEENFTDTTQKNLGRSQFQQAETSSQNQSSRENQGISQLQRVETSSMNQSAQKNLGISELRQREQSLLNQSAHNNQGMSQPQLVRISSLNPLPQKNQGISQLQRVETSSMNQSAQKNRAISELQQREQSLLNQSTQNNQGMSQPQQVETSSLNQSAQKNREMSQLRQVDTSLNQSAAAAKMIEPKKVVQSPPDLNSSSRKITEAKCPLTQSTSKVTGESPYPGRLEQIPQFHGEMQIPKNIRLQPQDVNQKENLKMMSSNKGLKFMEMKQLDGVEDLSSDQLDGTQVNSQQRTLSQQKGLEHSDSFAKHSDSFTEQSDSFAEHSDSLYDANMPLTDTEPGESIVLRTKKQVFRSEVPSVRAQTVVLRQSEPVRVVQYGNRGNGVQDEYVGYPSGYGSSNNNYQKVEGWSGGNGGYEGTGENEYGLNEEYEESGKKIIVRQANSRNASAGTYGETSESAFSSNPSQSWVLQKQTYPRPMEKPAMNVSKNGENIRTEEEYRGSTNDGDIFDEFMNSMSQPDQKWQRRVIKVVEKSQPTGKVTRTISRSGNWSSTMGPGVIPQLSGFQRSAPTAERLIFGRGFVSAN